MNKKLLYILIALIIPSIAHAIIIESTTSNQVVYSDGDLIEISVETNVEGLQVTADFNQVDSSFNQNMVIIEPEGTTYNIFYTITFGNTKSDNTYNVIISLYDNETSQSSTVTYTVVLENLQTTAQEDQQTLVIKVNDEDIIDVKSGTVQVCTNKKCTTFSEKDYEETRNIYISKGKVTLSDLTYNQLKDEISSSANQKIDENLRKYISELVNIKQLLDDGLYDIKTIEQSLLNTTGSFKNETARVIKIGNRNNLITLIGVFLMISSLLYILYLRTETTWLVGP